MHSFAPVSQRVCAALCLSLLSACGEGSRLPEHADVGPNPVLSKPQTALLPTVNIAPADPWPQGRAPLAAAGLQVSAFATGLQHPRWLHVLPNGDVLVAETNAPPRPEDDKGFKAWVMKKMMSRAGAATPSANRITLFRDDDGDGKAETRTVFIEGLKSPFGMALVGDRFYVANTDSVWEYPYVAGAMRIDGAGRQLTELPGGPLNHHWTKSLIASPDGRMLYATVGSNSNVAENGITAEEGRAAIWQIDRATGSKRLYATGLRNPNGMAWVGHGDQAVLWTVVNERDELGNDLVPDYLTSVRDGAFYGWPYSWYGGHVDERVKPSRPDLVATAVVPDYALGSHVAPLGLAASFDSPIPPRFGRAPPAAVVNAPVVAAQPAVPGDTASAPNAAAAATAPAASPAQAGTPAAPASAALPGATSTPAAAAAPMATASAPGAGFPGATASSTAPPAAPIQGLFVGLHGSWNRKPHSGYKVIFVPFANGAPDGVPVDVLTGFLSPDGKAWGRPVGVAMDPQGALLVADDVGNTVWRVSAR